MAEESESVEWRSKMLESKLWKLETGKWKNNCIKAVVYCLGRAVNAGRPAPLGPPRSGLFFLRQPRGGGDEQICDGGGVTGLSDGSGPRLDGGGDRRHRRLCDSARLAIDGDVGVTAAVHCCGLRSGCLEQISLRQRSAVV
nr:hypothetical protein Iba_scaffold37921CG0080 [Ipomoea batatas]